MRIAMTFGLVLAGCGGSSSNQPSCPTCPADSATDSADSPSCTEAWECTPWQTDGSSDGATRTCTDLDACGTTATKPAETATLPALDADYYECNVEPVVTRDCSMLGCHGKETGRAYRVYARGRLRITGMTITETTNSCNDQGATYPSERCIGDIECGCFTQPQLPAERRRSFDAARGLALDDRGVPLADPTQSPLLREPMVGGGFPHAGISIFAQSDASYMAIASWLTGASLGHACNSKN